MTGPTAIGKKVTWSGRVAAVQPRIRITRSFDERSHSYLGYLLRIDGTCGGEAGEFLIAVGEGARVKHRFQTGMEVSGSSVPVEDPRKETAALYKKSGLKVVKNVEGETPAGPPFLGVPPNLEACRSRGHRRLDARGRSPDCRVARRLAPRNDKNAPVSRVIARRPTGRRGNLVGSRDFCHGVLDARTYDTKCMTCIRGCRMPVEMIVDQWNPSKKQYRFETFCYGPKNCPFHRPGPARKVPGRKGMSYTEEDWGDEDATAHRELDD